MVGPWTELGEFAMKVTDDFPISFPGNESKKVAGGFKVKCREHGWQKISRKEIENAKTRRFEQAKVSWTHLNKAKKLFEDYNDGKIKDFHEYARRYTILMRERGLWEIVGNITTDVELPCGCSVSVRFECGEVVIPKEPRLHEVLLDLGLKTEDDMTLINKAFINEPQTQRIMDACKKRAKSIIGFLEMCRKEEKLLDNLEPGIKEALNDIFPISGIEAKILSYSNAQCVQARNIINESRETTISELIAPFMIWSKVVDKTRKIE